MSALSNEDFRLFKELVCQESGIYLRDERHSFLEAKLQKRLKATGVTSPYRYYKLLTEAKGKQELLLLLDLLTIKETSFFRNMPQFELLKEVVLPDVVLRRMKEGKKILRLWSAGCSTGQEPYSMAMTVVQSPPFPRLWDITILASDLSLTVIESAKAGIYPKEKVKDVETSYLARYFHRRGDVFAIKDEVRRCVVFDYHNLKHENSLQDLDVIFCRNVMIYFDRPEQLKLIEKLHRALAPGGYLFLGYAESLYGLRERFRFVHQNNGTAYQKIV